MEFDTFDTFESLLGEFRKRTGTALLFEDRNFPGGKGFLSYKDFASLIASKADQIRSEGRTADFVRAAHTPDTLVTIFADVIAGCSVVLLDPGLPLLKENAVRKLLPAQLKRKAFSESTAASGSTASADGDHKSGEAETDAAGDAGGEVEISAADDAGGEVEISAAEDAGGEVEISAAGGTPEESLSEGKLIFFTSGTTHSSKAVVLSAKALLHAAWRGQECLPAGEGDILLSILPLSHVFGFVCTMLWGLCYGAAVALGRGVRHLMDDPKFFHPTILPLVPVLAGAMTRFSCYNPELKVVLIGAAPLSGNELEAMKSKTSAKIYTGYGLTETASGVAITEDVDDPCSLRVCPGVELKLGPDNEILLKTDSLLERYIELLPVPGQLRDVINRLHRDSEEQPLLDEEGFFHTGDIGSFDKNGRIHISGRKKDIIVLPDGTKIFCPEYEKALADALGTDELAVTKRKGRAILLISDKVKKETAEKVVSELNQRLSRSQQIAGITYISVPLPRTVTGKLKRWMIEKAILKGDFEVWKQ